MIIPLFKTTNHCPNCGSENLKPLSPFTINCDNHHQFASSNILVVKWIQEKEILDKYLERILAINNNELYNKMSKIERERYYARIELLENIIRYIKESLNG